MEASEINIITIKLIYKLNRFIYMLLNLRKKYDDKKNIKTLIGIDRLNKDKLIRYKLKSKRIPS